MSNEVKNEEICCPRFDPQPWEDKVHDWDNKKFIKAKVRTFLFMPLNFGSVMTRLNKTVESSDAAVPDWLCLSDHTSRWNMDVYLAVDKTVPGAENVDLSGKFYTKVYEGDFKETGKWHEDFSKALESKSLKSEKNFMWYTTCPKCAKKYGKNYVVLFGKVFSSLS